MEFVFSWPKFNPFTSLCKQPSGCLHLVGFLKKTFCVFVSLQFVSVDKKSHLVEFQQLNPIIVSINIIIIIIIIICRALFTTQSEYLQMDTERKQIVLYVQKCILTPKNLHS